MKKFVLFGASLILILSLCSCITGNSSGIKTVTSTDYQTVTLNNTVLSTIYETKPAETVMYTEITTIKEIHTKVSPIIVPKTVIETSILTSTVNGTALTTTTLTTDTTIYSIQFAIYDLANNTYYAKENQTWEEWINDDNFFKDDGNGYREYKENGQKFYIDGGYVKWINGATISKLYEAIENNQIPASASILKTAYYHGYPYSASSQAAFIQTDN